MNKLEKTVLAGVISVNMLTAAGVGMALGYVYMNRLPPGTTPLPDTAGEFEPTIAPAKIPTMPIVLSTPSVLHPPTLVLPTETAVAPRDLFNIAGFNLRGKESNGVLKPADPLRFYFNNGVSAYSYPKALEKNDNWTDVFNPFKPVNMSYFDTVRINADNTVDGFVIQTGHTGKFTNTGRLLPWQAYLESLESPGKQLTPAIWKDNVGKLVGSAVTIKQGDKTATAKITAIIRFGPKELAKMEKKLADPQQTDDILALIPPGDRPAFTERTLATVICGEKLFPGESSTSDFPSRVFTFFDIE